MSTLKKRLEAQKISMRPSDPGGARRAETGTPPLQGTEPEPALGDVEVSGRSPPGHEVVLTWPVTSHKNVHTSWATKITGGPGKKCKVRPLAG